MSSAALGSKVVLLEQNKRTTGAEIDKMWKNAKTSTFDPTPHREQIEQDMLTQKTRFFWLFQYKNMVEYKSSASWFLFTVSAVEKSVSKKKSSKLNSGKFAAPIWKRIRHDQETGEAHLDVF